MDEVGRGALAGPVSGRRRRHRRDLPSAPIGVKDSKLLTAAGPRRAGAAHPALGPCLRGRPRRARRDRRDRHHGRRSGWPACARSPIARLGVVPDLVILDGNHDWLTPPDELGLFAFADESAPATPPVTTMIKADLKCSSVAAACVLAKVERDGLMVRARRRPPGLRLGGQQGLRRARAHGRARGARAVRPAPPLVAPARMLSLEELLDDGVVN